MRLKNRARPTGSISCFRVLRAFATLFIGCALAAPVPAFADAAADLDLAVERTGDEPVTLGDGVPFRVTLTNTGTRVRKVVPLEVSFQSLTFHIEREADGAGFYLIRFRPSVFDMKEPERVALDPGKSITTMVNLPMVYGGKVEVIGKYQGFEESLYPEVLSAPAAELTVLGEGQRLVATLETDSGTVTLALEPDVAPATVANFVDLANRGFYDGTIFHRVIAGFMIQGGDPQSNGSGGPGYNVPAEFSATRKHVRGTLSMARRGDSPHSAGSQFFICLEDKAHLDGQYTAFGQVVTGQEVVSAIGAVETAAQERPKSPVHIVRLRVAAGGPAKDERK